MLALLLALTLPINFAVMNATGPVLFDGNAIAYVHLNGTNAAIELPLLPGEHTIFTNKAENISFFDYVCSYEGLFECNITAHHNLILPFQMSCGTHPTGELVLMEGKTQTILAGGDCDMAFLRIGDFEIEKEFTKVFTNYIIINGESNVTVSQENSIILTKFGRSYTGFPELTPGEYWVEAGFLKGKLIIEPVKTAVYGYALSTLIVMSAIFLLWKG